MKERIPLPKDSSGMLWLVTNGRPHWHRHSELEFDFVRRGKAAILLPGRKIILSRGSLLWLFPKQDHILVQATPDFEMWVAVFRPSVVRAWCSDAPVLKKGNPAGVFHRRLPPKFHDCLDGVAEDISAHAKNPLDGQSGLPYLLRLAWRAYAAASDLPLEALIHPAVERAANLLRSEPEPMAMPQLSRRAGLSTARLSRLFKKQMGISLSHYRQRVALERYLKLYGSGFHMTMLQAALEAGFGSYAQFHRTFRQIMGISPREYAQTAPEISAGEN